MSDSILDLIRGTENYNIIFQEGSGTTADQNRNHSQAHQILVKLDNIHMEHYFTPIIDGESRCDDNTAS